MFSHCIDHWEQDTTRRYDYAHNKLFLFDQYPCYGIAISVGHSSVSRGVALGILLL